MYCLLASLALFRVVAVPFDDGATSSSLSNDNDCACKVSRQSIVQETSSCGSLLSIQSNNSLKYTGHSIPSIDVTANASQPDTVLIPGGIFHMGLKRAIIHTDGETPRRQVKLNSYFIDRYEVSNRQFEEFVLATNYVTESEEFGWSFVFDSAIPPKIKQNITQAVLGAEWWLPVNGSFWREPEGPGTDVFLTNRANHPVVQISWTDAVAYCKWRGARLPTEAEWEYAAQGTGIGRTAKFPWGDAAVPRGKHQANLYQGDFPDRSAVADGFEFLSPVDAYGPQNEYGLYNMIGNAWEWVEDWFTTDHASYMSLAPSAITLDPKGPSTGRDKVKKGGSFLCHKSYCYRYRTAARYYSTPDSASLNTGVRCAKSVDIAEVSSDLDSQASIHKNEL